MYHPFLLQELEDVRMMKREEGLALDADLDISSLSLSLEEKELLSRHKPASVSWRFEIKRDVLT